MELLDLCELLPLVFHLLLKLDKVFKPCGALTENTAPARGLMTSASSENDDM